MASYVKFQAFVEHMAEKVHNLGADQFTIALATNANIPSVSADAVLADLPGEISYTNLGSRDYGATTSSAQTSGTYKLVIPDLVLTASGAVATFRHPILYNNTPTSPADPLVCMWDHGSDVTLASGETFTLDMDGTNGLLQVA
jgi:hypothetical protein